MDARNSLDRGEDARMIVTTRVFDAPRELVFEAWTNPKHLVQWWGPHGFTTTIRAIDVRPGGVWRFVMHGPDGVDYRESDRLQRDRETRTAGLQPWRGRRCRARAVSGDGDLRRSRWQNQAHHEGAFPVGRGTRPGGRKYGAVEGAKQTLERLAEHLATMGWLRRFTCHNKGNRRDENRTQERALLIAHRNTRRSLSPAYSMRRVASSSRRGRSPSTWRAGGVHRASQTRSACWTRGWRRWSNCDALPRWHRTSLRGVYRRPYKASSVFFTNIATDNERKSCPRRAHYGHLRRARWQDETHSANARYRGGRPCSRVPCRNGGGLDTKPGTPRRRAGEILRRSPTEGTIHKKTKRRTKCKKSP